MNPKQIEALRKQLSSQTLLIGSVSRWQAFKTLAGDGSPQAVALLREVAAEAPDEAVRKQALETLTELAEKDNQKAKDAICQLVIHNESAAAEEIALERGFRPTQLQERALFFFLTEQWEPYEDLDFDQSLLQTAYESANASLRGRIAEKARAGERHEVINLIASGRRNKHLTASTEPERQAMLDLLTGGNHWNEMWELAQKAPVAFGVQILKRLQESPWRPADVEHLEEFNRLVDLAQYCEGEPPGNWAGASQDVQEFKLNCSCLAISPQGIMATGTNVQGSDHQIQLWDLHEGEELTTLEGHDKRVSCLAISPDGKTLASGSWDRTIRLWDLPDGKLRAVLEGHTDWVSCATIGPGGKLMATGSWDNLIHVWRLPKGEPVKTLEGHEGWLNCLTIGSGWLLASAGEEPHIYLRDLHDDKLIGLLEGHTGPVRALAIRGEGRQLISAGDDGSIRFWSIRKMREKFALEDAHRGPVRSLALSSDGRLLASAGEDGLVKLWNLPDIKPLQTLQGHSKAVCALAISPKGRLLASGGEDQRVRLWPSPVAHLTHLPISQTTLQDQTWAQQTLDRDDALPEEKPWLQLTVELMNWRRRNEIELDVEESEPERILAGEFDIEIDSL